MKIRIIVWVTAFALLSVLPWSVTWAADESLVLYLTFDNDQGDDVMDLSMYDNHGIIRGDLERVDGVFEDALYLSGLGNTVEVPHHNSLNMRNAFTLEMWVQLDADGGADSEVGIEKGGWEVGEYALYAHYVPGNGAAVQVMELPVACGDANEAPLGPDLRDGEWHHLAGVWDGEEIFLYADGELSVSWDCSGGPLGKNSQSIFIGSRTSSMRWLKGAIDEVRIYNRALSEAEVNTDMETLGGLAVLPAGKLAVSWADVKQTQ